MKQICSQAVLLLVLCYIVFSTSEIHAQAWIALGTPGFSPSSIDAISITIDTGGTPYVVYDDENNGLKTTVMKYNGSSWVNVGSPDFSASYANYTSIAINSSGTPYVVYADGVSIYDTAKATVMKYNGSNWVNVGTAGFSAGQAVWTSIAIGGSGTPYVVYEDVGNGNKATVMKYNGSNWVNVGSAGFSDSLVAYTSIAIDRSGTPYVVYQDGGDSNKATVMKFDSGIWVTIGSEGFSAGEADFTSIAIDSGGTPYVVYEDYGNNYNTTVMKYNGSNWVNVGSAGFSAGQADWTSIAIDKTATPYVVYSDYAIGGNATVMKYNGSSWVTVSIRGFSEGYAECTSIAIDNTGTPFVAYMDDEYGNKATVMILDTSLSPITGIGMLCIGATTTLHDAKSDGTWSSSNTAIVIIDTAGFVTSLASGMATISYTISGNSAIFDIVVDSLPMAGLLSASVDSICPGDSTIIHNTVDGGTWMSMDTSIAVFKSDQYISSSSYALLVGVASGSATLGYVNTNNCGSDTITYSFLVGCSPLIKVITNPVTMSLTIFPNPATSELTIIDRDSITTITITNLLGQIVFSHKYSPAQVQIQVDVTTLPTGIYFVKVNGTDVRKFVKQ